jgi:FkbM family methyltransferase
VRQLAASAERRRPLAAKESTKLLLRPRSRREFKRRRRFLAQFVSPGDLVFDVGANIGDYSATFLSLGARPIAIEPTPELQPILRERLRRVPIEAVALSDDVGTAQLLIGARHTDATLSTRYAEVLERELGVTLHAIEVPVTTMDELAAKYGMPSFVKIDVEGHEPAVLRGMNFDPPVLSFEFHGSLLREAAQCVEVLEQRGYRFRPVIGFQFEWAGAWQSGSELLEMIAANTIEDRLLFGDAYCVARS